MHIFKSIFAALVLFKSGDIYYLLRSDVKIPVLASELLRESQ